MSISRAVAKKTIDQLGINSPADLIELEDICWALGAYVQYEDIDGAEARITMDGDRGVITAGMNQLYPARTRFSVGHELGHFLLHRDKKNEFLCHQRDMTDWFSTEAQKRLEVEANEFSIEFLIPQVFANPILKKQRPGWAVVDELIEIFQMSTTASVKRFIELSSEPVAAVFYNKDMVTHHFRSQSFEEQGFWVPKGGVSADTFASDAIKGTAPKKMSAVAASAWFKVKPWLEDETIFEEARFFPKIGTGVSILWVNNRKLLK